MKKLLSIFLIISFPIYISGSNNNDKSIASTPTATPYNPFLNKFKCFVNVCEQVADKYGFNELWNETNEQIQRQFLEWENCSKKGNPIFVYK